MSKEPGIVLLTTKWHIGSIIFLNMMVESGVNVQAVVESQTVMSRNNNINNYIKQIQVMGISQTAQRLLFTIFQDTAIWISVGLSYFGRPQKLLSPRQISKRYRIPIIKTKDINSADTMEKIKSIGPDILVSAYFNQILKKNIIELPRVSCVNLHLALAQKYRGLNSYFWVLAKGERETGVTLHEVDEGIDTGRVIAQKIVEIDDKESANALFIRLSRTGAQLFVDSLDQIGKGEYLDLDMSGSEYYSTFTKKAYCELVQSARKFFRFSDIRPLF